MNLDFFLYFFSNKGLPERRWRDQTQPLCSETNALLMWCNGDAYRTNGQTGGPGRSSAEAETRRFRSQVAGWFGGLHGILLEKRKKGGLLENSKIFWFKTLFVYLLICFFVVLKATSVWSVSRCFKDNLPECGWVNTVPRGIFFLTRWVFIRVTQIDPDFGTSAFDFISWWYGLWTIPTCHHWWIKKSSWDPPTFYYSNFGRLSCQISSSSKLCWLMLFGSYGYSSAHN